MLCLPQRVSIDSNRSPSRKLFIYFFFAHVFLASMKSHDKYLNCDFYVLLINNNDLIMWPNDVLLCNRTTFFFVENEMLKMMVKSEMKMCRWQWNCVVSFERRLALSIFDWFTEHVSVVCSTITLVTLIYLTAMKSTTRHHLFDSFAWPSEMQIKFRLCISTAKVLIFHQFSSFSLIEI